MKRRVALLFGGRSAEHEISCVSARSVAEALDPDRYDLVSVGITREGTWHVLPGGPPQLLGPGGDLPAVTSSQGRGVSLSQETGKQELVGEDGSQMQVDVVIPLVHGPYGEDGTVQGMLELAGVPYVGAGVLGSALGMDKAVQKTVLAAAGMSVVPHVAVNEFEWNADPARLTAAANDLGYPLFVKPANLGSSIGITKVHDPSDLAGAMAEAFRYDTKAIVEASIEGAREIECAVLGNDDPEASLPGEIVPSGEFYDYKAKYVDEDSELMIPVKLPERIVAAVQRDAVTAFKAIQCSGMARVDFFYREPEDLIVNELNTIPGFTSISMYPKLWEASGLTYPQLLDRLIELAIERHERRAKKETMP
ncbi:MAG: D-alanine--D-alanine ligase family protein [Actinomycetota bacterium]